MHICYVGNKASDIAGVLFFNNLSVVVSGFNFSDGTLTQTNVLQPGETVYVLLSTKRSQPSRSRASAVCLPRDRLSPCPNNSHLREQISVSAEGERSAAQFIFNGAVVHRVRHLEFNWKVAVAEVPGKYGFRTETAEFTHL